NIVGGFAIGVFQGGMSLAEALQKYTLLSIGDGLVAQIPALVISIGAGLLVTRANENANLGAQITGQLFRYPRALTILSGMLAVFGLVPGMPAIPFFLLAAGAGLLARNLKSPDAAAPAAPAAAKGKGGKAPAKGAAGAAAPAAPLPSDDVRKLIEVDVFAIEIGCGLLGLADAKAGGDLLARITGVRKNLARERGIIVPPISVRDNLELAANDYRFLIRGKAVARGQIMAGRWLAMNVSGSQVALKGVPTREPVFKLEATWID